MKNAIVILVDSVFSDCISTKRTKESTTPFIDSLVDHSLFADSVYSFGPHTDAASKGLYCGNHSLDDYGYYFGMNSSPYNIHRVFKENGYETYAYYYPYYFIGPKTNRYIDHIVYTSGMIWPAIWFGKYEYYAEQLKNRELTTRELEILEKFTDFLFDVWRSFYTNLEQMPDASLIINPIKEKKDNSGKTTLEEEYKKYLLGKRTYILDLLNKGLAHPFSLINDYNPDNYIDVAFLKYIYSKHRHFFNKLIKANIISNLRNNELPLSSGLGELLHKGVKQSTLTRWLLCLFAPISVKNRSLKPKWQFEPSFNNQITTMFKQIDERNQTEKPFFFSIHTEDAHQNISFLSFDMDDKALIADELDYLKPLVEGCGKDYKGNLTYQLALRYVDLGIKRIFEGLKNRDLLKDTSIVLMADHGSSFTGFPSRDVVVNNFHVENYKTPFLIWNYESQMFNGYYSNKYSADMVLPTICKSFGFEIPAEICQSTIMDNPHGKPYIITEYMGRGCPDMISREVWISLRNDKYCIAYKSRIDEPFDIEHPYCIYDLKNDVNEKRNLADTYEKENDEIKKLMILIKHRFDEIQQSTNNLLENDMLNV